jgi:predicted transcriptional regulator
MIETENKGWIKIHRKIMETSWYKRSIVVHLFIHLLIKANHQESKFFWNGKEITIKRGEFITGLSKLSEETGISIQSIRTALNILKSTNTITIKSTNKFSIIQIVNYDQYQNEDIKSTSKLTSKVTNNQQTTNKQLTTNKNDKNDKNEKNIKNNNINIIIGMFKNVNPSYERLFANKTQRDSVERLLKKYGEAWLRSLINRLPEIIKMPYAPQITTPYELEMKLGKLKIFLEQEKNKVQEKGLLQL